MFPGCYGTEEDDDKREAEQLAALRRADELIRLRGEIARLKLEADQYRERVDDAIFNTFACRLGPDEWYHAKAEFCRELESESEETNAAL